MCDFEIEIGLLRKNYQSICGIDEVGRGALFGPVVSGAVVLNPEKLHDGIRDSKQISQNRRLEIADFIYRYAQAYSIGWSWNEEIDRINILEATKQSMKMAVEKLQIIPDYLLVDGLNPDFLGMRGEKIIKGDCKSMSIAAASIIAKVFRDQMIQNFSKFFPGYNLEKNKG
jgi:ribonuclease HII